MKALILLTCFFSVVFGLRLANSGENSLDDEVNKFLDALLRKDENKLISYMSDSKSFLDNGKIDKEVMSFLYDSDFSEEGWKSVTEIAALGKILFNVVKKDDGVITVLFYPLEYKEQMQDIKFLEEEWMKKYFACEFEVKNNKLEFYQNVCFSETDGAFSSTN